VATARLAVLYVATPEPLSAPEPDVVEPSMNKTFPVALLSEDVTVAVKVTELPNAEGLLEEETAVVVARLVL